MKSKPSATSKASAQPVKPKQAPASPNGEGSAEMKAICERYKRLYAGLLFDVLEHLGHANQALSHEIMPLSPEMKLAGPAFTFKGTTSAVKDESVRFRRLNALKEMTY